MRTDPSFPTFPLAPVNDRFCPDASFQPTRASQKMAEAEGSLIAERNLMAALIVHGAPPPELLVLRRDPCPAVPRICQRHASEICAACPVTAERHLGCVFALSLCPFLSHSPSTRSRPGPSSEMSATATASTTGGLCAIPAAILKYPCRASRSCTVHVEMRNRVEEDSRRDGCIQCRIEGRTCQRIAQGNYGIRTPHA